MMAQMLHGGRLDSAIAEFGGCREAWLDLSTGINPNPYPIGTIDPQAFQRLPDYDAECALERATRQAFEVPDSRQLVMGNGTQALIELLPRVIGAKDITIVSPTYGEHAHVWAKNGCAVTTVAAPEDIQSADVAIVVNPNNPDCRVHRTDTLFNLSAKVNWLIVDEAFCDTMPETSIVSQMPDNVIVLKSFGKFFGLAGVRLGFAICNADIAEKLREQLGPWAVSGPALAIGARAYLDDEWISRTRRDLNVASMAMADLLSRSGLDVCGVNPLFVFARHKRANSVFKHLAAQHILIRPFPDNLKFLRFGLHRQVADLNRLSEALKGVDDV